MKIQGPFQDLLLKMGHLPGHFKDKIKSQDISRISRISRTSGHPVLRKNSWSPKKISGKWHLFCETISLRDTKFYLRTYGDCNPSQFATVYTVFLARMSAVNCYFWGNTKIVFTPTGKTALTGKDIMNIDL